MPRLNASNRAKTTLAQAINPTATTFIVADTSIFPDAPFLVTVEDEIMEIGEVSKATDTFSEVLRGREGTTAADHPEGASVENRFTAGMFNDLRIYEDEGENPDYAGTKYKLVMINGEPFMEVVEV
jgi:hypothetical protein